MRWIGLLIVTLAGCSSPGTTLQSRPASASAVATTSPAVAASAAPCTPPAPELTIDGRVVVVRPVRSASFASPGPLLILLHGYKGTPQALVDESGLAEVAPAAGVTVAYPSGTPLDLGFGWNSGSARSSTTGVDDVAFLADVVDELVGSGCVDPARVVVGGQSNGAGMALRLWCSGVVRLSGLVLVNSAIDRGVLDNCTGDASRSPVDVLAVAGLEDTSVRFDGSRPPYLPVPEWFGEVAGSLGCTGPVEGSKPGTPDSEDSVDSVAEMRRTTGCEECAELLVLSDGGHVWPGSDFVNGTNRASRHSIADSVVQLALGSCPAG